MNHSKPGLNEPFYKWIDDVRRALRKEKELQRKLEFYNMKLIRYKGVSYDRIGSSGSRSSGDSELLYWIDRIFCTEQAILKLMEKSTSYNRFRNLLSKDETLVIDYFFSQIKNKSISESTRFYYYKQINNIAKKWFLCKTI